MSLVSSSSTTHSSPTQSRPLEDYASDGGSDTANAATGGKKQAWIKPPNGVPEAVVMGAVSWPALSESARAAPRSSSNFSNSDTAVASQHKPMKGGGEPAGDSEIMPSSIPLSTPPPSTVVSDSPARDLTHGNSDWEVGSKEPAAKFHNGNGHRNNSFRRGKGGGPHPRRGGGVGDGHYHSNYLNRHDRNWPNHEWSPQQNFSGRNGHVQQQRFMPRTFHRPALNPPAFVSPPPPIQTFVNPMGFPDLPSSYFFLPTPPPESFGGGVQYISHAMPPVMYYQHQDPQLLSVLVKQIDYYFSSENLCKDIFLRQNMDEHGWVPISLIAGFNRVKQLTKDVQCILDAVQMSTVVELQGDKIRKRHDWMNWLLPPSNQFTRVSSRQSSEASNFDILATRMQSFGLEGTAGNDSMKGNSVEPIVFSRSSSMESNNR